MSNFKIKCGKIEISNENKICIIAGPCQLETEQHAMDMAGKIQEITKKFGLGFIYKKRFTGDPFGYIGKPMVESRFQVCSARL